MTVLRMLGLLVNLMAGVMGRSAIRDLERLQVLYAPMGDEQLRAELSRLLDVNRASRDSATKPFRWLSRFQDSRLLYALAIGTCLFDRYPCDLPPGSKAYDEQKLAAMMLVDQTNVQMDTGEGKTYAIALAATALLTEHPQVIVITANDYLAHRDQARVSPYFEAAGIACTYGVPGPDFRGIAYTTLTGVCFGYLSSTYGRPNPAQHYPIRAAVIIDEIDSVLLDQPLVHSLIRILPSDERLWENIFRLADGWDERQYTHDPVSDDYSLTADAWEEVAQLAHETGKPTSLLMRLASAALWARRAEAGHHYLIEDGHVRLIGQITGQTFNSGSPQESALQYMIAGRNPPVSLKIAEIDGLTLLRRHPYVVGLSGTAREDTIYYLQQLGTLTAEVPPRFMRYKSKTATIVAISREAAFGYLTDRIREVQPRPVVIGTWSPAEARAIADKLQAEGIVNKSALSVITTFDSETDPVALDVAGEPGRVTVLSQGGSRGVDVRSTHRPLLMVLGRAAEPRLDRQFLGRVGRHGEPFDAEFILDPSSPIPLPYRFLSKLVEKTMPATATAARAISQRQRDVYAYRVRRRQQVTVLSRAIGAVEATIAAEFQRLRRLSTEAELRDYITELCSGPEVDQGREPDPADRPGADAVQRQVIGAIERRHASDGVVERFEAAVRAAVGSEKVSYELRTTILGVPAEITALTRWLSEGVGRLLPEDDSEQAALFRQQAAEASRQYLPVHSTPHYRDPIDIIYEVRTTANATLLERTRHRLDSLRVTSSTEGYYRRSAFTVRNLHKLSELSMPREILSHLSLVDRPVLLNELYYSNDHAINSPTQSRNYVPAVTSPTTHPAVERLNGAEAETAVEQFLTNREREPGGLAIPPDTARLLLLDIINPLRDELGSLSAAVLRRHINLILDSLAAKGVGGGKLRDHRRIIFDFCDYLYQQGILTERLTREASIASTMHRVRDFVATIPRFGVVTTLGYLVVVALGTLLVADPARHSEFTDIATRLFGFGLVLPDRPLLGFFAILIIFGAAARACGAADPTIITARLAPVIAIAITVIFYNRGFANLGWTVLLTLALMFWSGALFAAQRFVTMFVGADANIILAAAAVATYLAEEIMNHHIQTNALVIIGVLAAVAGPAIPVSIGSSEYVKGTFRHADDRARIRIALDPAVTSGLLSFVATSVVARVHGTAAAVSFVVVQLIFLAAIAGNRLRPSRIKGILAKLQVGIPMNDDQLNTYLRRAMIRSMMIAAAALSVTAAVSALAAEPVATEFFLEEWAGVMLVSGVVAIGSSLSVAGTSMPMLPPRDDDMGTLERLRQLREQFRSWRRMRYAWVWKIILSGVVIFGILQWVSDWIGVTDVSRTIWQALTHLIH